MKKIIISLLVFGLLISIAGCGNKTVVISNSEVTSQELSDSSNKTKDTETEDNYAKEIKSFLPQKAANLVIDYVNAVLSYDWNKMYKVYNGYDKVKFKTVDDFKSNRIKHYYGLGNDSKKTKARVTETKLAFESLENEYQMFRYSFSFVNDDNPSDTRLVDLGIFKDGNDYILEDASFFNTSDFFLKTKDLTSLPKITLSDPNWKVVINIYPKQANLYTGHRFDFIYDAEIVKNPHTDRVIGMIDAKGYKDGKISEDRDTIMNGKTTYIQNSYNLAPAFVYDSEPHYINMETKLADLGLFSMLDTKSAWNRPDGDLKSYISNKNIKPENIALPTDLIEQFTAAIRSGNIDNSLKYIDYDTIQEKSFKDMEIGYAAKMFGEKFVRVYLHMRDDKTTISGDVYTTELSEGDIRIKLIYKNGGWLLSSALNGQHDPF